MTMYRILLLMVLSAFLFSTCSQENALHERQMLEQIRRTSERGNFIEADSLIDLALHSILKQETKDSLLFEKERFRRIKLDFKRDESYVKEKLSATFMDLTDEQLRIWEQDKSLEMKIIDGERRYFNWAHRNLFRVNKEAKKHLQLDANQSDGITGFCESFVPEMIVELAENQQTTTKTYHFDIEYTLTVDSGAVKHGDTLRVWLPFPKPNKYRQFNIELLSTSENKYILASENQAHRSLYFERLVQNSDEQLFKIKYRVSTRGQWFGKQLDDIRPYQKESEFYQKYTSERAPHIVFSDRLKHLTDSVVGENTQPYEIVKAIYNWIDDHIPWASAREYSTILNIPEYALENMHGDCGIQTLLFITMARHKGIPAKWQSGWILIPDEVGLHDWAEVYYEGLGWVPVDQSFERINSKDEDVKYFYTCGIDPYRLIVNDDFSQAFYPTKKHFRSETIDFQRGEVENQDRNLYFNEWSYRMEVEYVEDGEGE